jgi:hypothetical protein
LSSEGRQPLSSSKDGLGGSMQQPQGIGYADIAEVRTVSGAAACNQLLADGWVLLGIYPLTAVAEMTPRASDGEQRKQDIQLYVRRFVGYVAGRRRE